MGCDIHMFSEKKPLRPAMDEEKEVWHNCDLFTMNGFYVKGEEDEEQFSVVEIYGGRNYNLFSILANVRNGADNNCICLPKGFPDDCCEYIRDQKKSWDGDGHSHSWFTLAELKAFRAEQKESGVKTKYSGMMSLEDAALVDDGQMPNSWCKWSSSSSYVYREWEYQQDFLLPLIEAMDRRVPEIFRYDSRPQEEKDADYRIVFWFDN